MTNREFLEAIMDPNNWRPNLTKIATETGLAVSTVSDRINSRLNSCLLEVHVVEFTESEAKRKREEMENRTNGHTEGTN